LIRLSRAQNIAPKSDCEAKRMSMTLGKKYLIENWDLFMFSKNEDSAEIERLRADTFFLRIYFYQKSK
jgi:hypothetical protein